MIKRCMKYFSIFCHFFEKPYWVKRYGKTENLIIVLNIKYCTVLRTILYYLLILWLLVISITNVIDLAFWIFKHTPLLLKKKKKNTKDFIGVLALKKTRISIVSLQSIDPNLATPGRTIFCIVRVFFVNDDLSNTLGHIKILSTYPYTIL